MYLNFSLLSFSYPGKCGLCFVLNQNLFLLRRLNFSHVLKTGVYMRLRYVILPMWTIRSVIRHNWTIKVVTSYVIWWSLISLIVEQLTPLTPLLLTKGVIKATYFPKNRRCKWWNYFFCFHKVYIAAQNFFLAIHCFLIMNIRTFFKFCLEI